MKRTESTVYTFQVVAERMGKYIIPGFKFEVDGKVYKTNDLSLIVSKADPGSSRQTTYKIKPEIEVSKESLFIGESLVVRYYLLSSGLKVNVQGFEKLPETKGFAVKQVEETLPDEIAQKALSSLVKNTSSKEISDMIAGFFKA